MDDDGLVLFLLLLMGEKQSNITDYHSLLICQFCEARNT